MLLFTIVQALSLLPASGRTASPINCPGTSQMLYNIMQPEVSNSQIHQMRLMYSTKGKTAAAGLHRGNAATLPRCSGLDGHSSPRSVAGRRSISDLMMTSKHSLCCFKSPWLMIQHAGQGYVEGHEQDLDLCPERIKDF